jgi:uncharacterized SAM-dependent methyltransferase
MTVPLDNTRCIDTCIEAEIVFKADVLSGLAAQQKAVPARWLYKRRGSELFEEITSLLKYYPTRTEARFSSSMRVTSPKTQVQGASSLSSSWARRQG